MELRADAARNRQAIVDAARTEFAQHGLDALVRLVERAQAAGVLRADFTTQDLPVLLMANAGLIERAGSVADDASARLVHVLLDGLRAPAATDGPVAPTPRRMRLAMRR